MARVAKGNNHGADGTKDLKDRTVGCVRALLNEKIPDFFEIPECFGV
jgi:hypothetical protein